MPDCVNRGKGEWSESQTLRRFCRVHPAAGRYAPGNREHGPFRASAIPFETATYRGARPRLRAGFCVHRRGRDCWAKVIGSPVGTRTSGPAVNGIAGANALKWRGVHGGSLSLLITGAVVGHRGSWLPGRPGCDRRGGRSVRPRAARGGAAVGDRPGRCAWNGLWTGRLCA